MGSMSNVRKMATAFLFLCLAAVSARAQHSGDVGVGRSAVGQLKCRLSDVQNPCFEPALGIGLLTPIPDATAPTSWRATSPGFDANFASDPAQDYYLLDYGAAIYLVAAEDPQPAFTVKYGTTTIRVAGDALPLGSATLHRHVIFVVDCTDPRYDPLRTLWYGTFILEDRGSTGYADSEPFTLRLSVVECETGDVDGDGGATFADINPFISVLIDPAAASVAARCGADVNRDGYVTFADINPFVLLLTQGVVKPNCTGRVVDAD